MKKLLSILLALLLVLTLGGCDKDERSEDVIILFTNDIHGEISGNISLSAIKKYKDTLKETHKYVTLVDCGDSIQGTSICTTSNGQALVEAMNIVGYDYKIFGNHEFDYGPQRLKELIELSDATYLNANVTYHGQYDNYLQDTKPYVIEEYGDIKVAFIGIDTPNTIIESVVASLKEDGEYVFDFAGGNNGLNLYELVQKYVDEVRENGADYVVVLGHLGLEDEAAPYRSIDLINNTTGIDVLLDGHSHSIDIAYNVLNKQGDTVLVGQTGTKLENIGELVITQSGTIVITNISDISDCDEDIDNSINEIKEKYEAALTERIFTNNVKLNAFDDNGKRLVRIRETNIGDFCADAVRYYGGGDIGFVNGGSIKADLNVGDITYEDIMNITPFSNTITSVEITGKELLDMLEYFAKNVKAVRYDADGNPTGEHGSFPNVSGIKFEIDTSIPTSVVVDDDDMLVEVKGERRVKNVLVLDGDNYVPIDENKTYIFTASDYICLNGGSGMGVMLKDHKVVANTGIIIYDAYALYLKEVLNYDLSKYTNIDNRIVIKNGDVVVD